MIYLKKFNESKESIEDICQKYGITNYTINDDGTIDVNGDVDLSFKELTRLPLKFRNITGNFYCSNNKLKKLDGAPQTIDGHFVCNYNQLTSLEGAPQSVGDNFYCSNNKLTTLEGAPTAVGGFYCYNNQLTTLEGAPRTVGFHFNCNQNQLVNLEFTPSCQILFCDNNPISKWWSKVDDIIKLYAFIDLGIDSRDPDFMNVEKINLLKE